MRSLRICCMKKTKRPPWHHLLFVMIAEMLQTIGLSILFYLVLPDLDAIRGMMLANGALLFPGLLKCYTSYRLRPKDSKLDIKTMPLFVIDVLAVVIQVIGILLWLSLNETKDWNHWQIKNSWALPLSLFFISFGWWESFVDEKASDIVSVYLCNIRRKMIHEGTRCIHIQMRVITRESITDHSLF